MEQRRTLLHATYKRLRGYGEDKRIIRKAVAIYTPEQSADLATRVIRCHKNMASINIVRNTVPWYRLVRRTSLKLQFVFEELRRKKVIYRINAATAIVDFMMFVAVMGVIFAIGRIMFVYRVKIKESDERYKAMAVPILEMALEISRAQQTKQQQEQQGSSSSAAASS